MSAGLRLTRFARIGDTGAFHHGHEQFELPDVHPFIEHRTERERKLDVID